MLLVVKKPACQCTRHEKHWFDPWVRKVLWRRAWQPTAYSCLENGMDRGIWWATVHWLAESWNSRLKRLCTHTRSEWTPVRQQVDRSCIMVAPVVQPCVSLGLWPDVLHFAHLCCLLGPVGV